MEKQTLLIYTLGFLKTHWQYHHHTFLFSPFSKVKVNALWVWNIFVLYLNLCFMVLMSVKKDKNYITRNRLGFSLASDSVIGDHSFSNGNGKHSSLSVFTEQLKLSMLSGCLKYYGIPCHSVQESRLSIKKINYILKGSVILLVSVFLILKNCYEKNFKNSLLHPLT